ncbi:MAG: 1-deoxy-D-xylulose-5-phosphate synthase [Acidimicrobiales bacterium]|jgi:1-deoxy-D-xylulose-5-phosphate synthase
MLLDSINRPSDLLRLSHDDLDQLAGEIRDAIIAAVDNSPGGGHLGSNLGVVELTIAMHRVFDSPTDILLWDTGHQAYVHKFLTGRRDAFTQLRQANGLSGYPCREESDHDWIENSHASTVLSYAHGLATARDLSGANHRHVVAVIGDGAMTGGMAFEGLNNLGHSGRDVTIILNDNGRSYAPTVSKLGESLAKLRINPKFQRQQSRMERLIADIPIVGSEATRAIDATKAAIREMWEPTSFFENLGVRYMGPFDGHDIAAIEGALNNARQLGGPVVVHVLTDKGHGYEPALADSIKKMHDTGAIKPGSFTAAFTDALLIEAEARPEVVALTAAMPDSTGLLPFNERFPDRCFDVGIAEQHAVTSAAGMAMGGLRPVFAVYSTFLTRAIDQVNLDVGLHGQPVVFCLDRAGITGDDGPSHHGILDMVLLTKVSGMTLFAPSSYEEVGQMLGDALDITTGPSALRWGKTPARRSPASEVGSGLSARKCRTGTDVCILSMGKMLDAAEEAADALQADGINATVWDIRVVPLDESMLAEAANHPLVVTIEDGLRAGGVGSMISDRLNQTEQRPAIQVLGVPTAYIPHGNASQILANLGLDGAGVAETVRKALRTAKLNS